MIACHSCISSGAKTEAEMKNVICQDYSCAYIYTHTHTHTLHTRIQPRVEIAQFLLSGYAATYQRPTTPSNDLHAARERRSPDLPLIAYRSPPPQTFTNSPSKSSRSRVHAPFSIPSLSSITVVRLYQPPLPPTVKSRPWFNYIKLGSDQVDFFAEKKNIFPFSLI